MFSYTRIIAENNQISSEKSHFSLFSINRIQSFIPKFLGLPATAGSGRGAQIGVYDSIQSHHALRACDQQLSSGFCSKCSRTLSNTHRQISLTLRLMYYTYILKSKKADVEYTTFSKMVYMKSNHKIIIGDSRNMAELPHKSVHLVITSPPYWQLKDYGTSDQIGFNDSYEDYINNLNLVWKEYFRVLNDGCRLCINIGDQFARSVYYGRYKIND